MKLQPYQEHMMKMLNKTDTKWVINWNRQNKSRSVLEFLELLRKANEK
jgi:hypothetical protein